MAAEPRRRIFLNGRVRLIRAAGGTHTTAAVGVIGDRIAAVGATADVRDEIGPAEEIDMNGGTLLPGFTDSHTHFKRASTFLALYIDFATVGPVRIADVQAAVADQASLQAPGAWIQGDGLDPTRLAERRFPHRHELDAVAPDRPVVLRSVGRHVVAANSIALRIAGIDASTPDPAGGRIERGDDGEPTGVLHEEAKLRLDANRSDTVIPPETEKDRLAALSQAVDLLHRNGIVAIHEMPRDPDQISDWLALRETEPPRIRVRFYVRGLAAQTNYEYLLGSGFRSEFGDEWLKLGGVKLSIDGSGAFGNAMTYDDYPDNPGYKGLQRIERDDFAEAVRRCHEGGLQLAVHAIGPRAVDMALDAFAALNVAGRDLAARRHRIEHAYLPGRPRRLERLRDLGLVLSTQPAAIEAVGDSWRRVFHDDELSGVMPLAAAAGLGIPIQINSDFPCAQLNPFVGLAAAVERRTASGHVLDAAQAVSVVDALRWMTTAPAWTAFEDGWRGAIHPGHAADLIVCDRDPVETDDLAGTRVTMTMVGGDVVYRA
jgi:predicted amidohydrolase YtcJ